MTPEDRKLLHLAVTVGYIRYVRSRVFEQGSFSTNERAPLAHLPSPCFETVRADAERRLRLDCLQRPVLPVAEAILLGSYGPVWRSARAALGGPDDGFHDPKTVIDPELTGIDESTRLQLIDRNRRLHLAVAVGYIRCALAAGNGGGHFEAARAHLSRPGFDDLGEIAGHEITAFAKDGLMNGADEKIASARRCEHGWFWSVANRELERRSWPSSAFVPIDPELLA